MKSIVFILLINSRKGVRDEITPNAIAATMISNRVLKIRVDSML